MHGEPSLSEEKAVQYSRDFAKGTSDVRCYQPHRFAVRHASIAPTIYLTNRSANPDARQVRFFTALSSTAGLPNSSKVKRSRARVTAV